MEGEERNENAESDQQEQINPVGFREQPGVGQADDGAKVECPHSFRLDQVESDQPQKENKAAERQVNCGLPGCCLPVTGAPDSDQ